MQLILPCPNWPKGEGKSGLLRRSNRAKVMAFDGPMLIPDPPTQPDREEHTDNTVPTQAKSMLPIVGLGGSAGGIGALRDFFSNMPTDSGMAFVVILHLAPDHESTLPEVLARSTSMPVARADDGQEVKVNCVYVIPPGKFLTLEDGRLRLTELKPAEGRRVTVDLFFRALADTRRGHAGPRRKAGAGRCRIFGTDSRNPSAGRGFP